MPAKGLNMNKPGLSVATRGKEDVDKHHDPEVGRTIDCNKFNSFFSCQAWFVFVIRKSLRYTYSY